MQVFSGGKMEQIEQYDNYVSLGWFCGTAGSLSRLGLRNFSGPFDWYCSDFDSVINQIDNEFIDFMNKKNLEVVENKPTVFIDKKYNFYCNHDIKENFFVQLDQKKKLSTSSIMLNILKES